MTDTTTASDRDILRDRLGDLDVRIFATDDPRRMEAEAEIGGQTVTLSVISAVPVSTGVARDAAVQMLAFGFRDRLDRLAPAH